jgi:hypothetical protein
MKWLALALLLVWGPALAGPGRLKPALTPVVVCTTSQGVAVATQGSLQFFDQSGKEMWSGGSVHAPTAASAASDRIAIIDSINNEVRIAALADGQGKTIRVGETPIESIFIDRDLFLLERDARTLERVGPDGTRSSLALPADPAFLRQFGGRLYVYARADGTLLEITTTPFAIRRSAHTTRFASDLEVDGRNAYLADPRAGNLAVVSLATMSSAGKIDVGAVPIDLAFAGASSALTARTLAVADPSAKRVWMIEGPQSLTQAVARGFLRGLLGLGLFGGRESQFPTGIDRVIIRGSRWYAYDTSSGTLYRFTKSKSSVLAKGVGPRAFSVGPGGVFVWDDAVRRLQHIEVDE